VGKSTIAALLAYGLSRSGAQVGLMDADVYGPSIPHLLGSTDRPTIADGRIQPVKVDGLVVMSMGYLVPPGEAVIWRGPMLHGAITQFLRDTEWGILDYLIIDLPPGTGDISLSLSQLLPLSGAVVVCTPQDVALLDATKAIAMYRKLNIEVLGMVENMSFFQCPDCGSRHEIFGSGGARRQAEKLNVPVLGEVPLNAQLRVLGDEGRVGSAFDDATSRPYLDTICENMVRNLIGTRKQKPPMPTLSVLK
jgi:ATP-binding protein involved in chromosome partitioning